jgi:hypothetical protein
LEVIFKYEKRFRYANSASSLRLDAPPLSCVGVESVRLSHCSKTFQQVKVSQGFHFSGDILAPNNCGIRYTITVIDGHPPGLVMSRLHGTGTRSQWCFYCGVVIRNLQPRHMSVSLPVVFFLIELSVHIGMASSPIKNSESCRKITGHYVRVTLSSTRVSLGGHDRLKLTPSAKQDINPPTMCEFMILRAADYGLRCMRFRYGFTAAAYFDDLK